MRPAQKFFAAVFLTALAVICAPGEKVFAQTVYGSTKLQWDVVPIVTLALTPNYQSGYGPTGGVGSGSTPAPGAGASLGGGFIDFGTQVVQGYQYLYRYAVQAGVLTNDPHGFTLYAEGTNINDNTLGGGATIPINQTLYWLASSPTNTPFTGATAFQATAFGTSAGCGGQCINYGASSPPATAVVGTYSSSTMGLAGHTDNIGYDYQLRLGSVTNADNFSVYITYTAVGN
jgi:hypothetical protein